MIDRLETVKDVIFVVALVWPIIGLIIVFGDDLARAVQESRGDLEGLEAGDRRRFRFRKK